MLKVLLARAQQKYRTIGFPKEPPVLPDRLRGRPQIDSSKCPPNCSVCADTCPTDAITINEKGVQLDLGRCLFCPECERACPEGAIRFTPEHRLAAHGNRIQRCAMERIPHRKRLVPPGHVTRQLQRHADRRGA